MADYVFLGSWDKPQMPRGALNEWAQYFARSGEELEAKNDVPPLWLALFGEADLRYAPLADATDIPNADGSTYPYFIAERAVALTRLSARRTAILTTIGAHYAPIYDAFIAYIEGKTAPYILTRTANIADISPKLDQWLRRDVSSLDHIDAHGVLPADSALASRLRQWQLSPPDNPIWSLCGTGNTDWPPKKLSIDFPVASHRRQPAPPKAAAKSKNGTLAETAAVILSAAAGLSVGYWTQSWALGALAFFVIPAIYLYWLIRKG